MNYTFEKSDDVGILTFQGRLSSDHIHEIKIALVKCIHSSERLIFNFNKVTGIDSSCLQLLREACMISGKLNKKPTLIGPSARAAVRSFAGAGLRPGCDCVPA